MTNEVTIESLQTEITRLKAHADDLLAERKAEKKRREDAETALQTVTGERDGLLSRLDDLTLSGPVLRALEGVTAAPPIQGRKLLEDAGVKFVIGQQGTAVALDGEEEISLSDLHGHLSKKCQTPEGMAAFGWIIRGSGASGSGAPGGGIPSFRPVEQKQQHEPIAKNLGLR